MQCPKCMGTEVDIIGTSHYVCKNPDCKMEDGSRTQFRVVEDEKVEFPYNQIFVNRPKRDFYRQPYLQLENVGVQEV